MVDGVRDEFGKRFRRFFETKDEAKAWLSNHTERTRVEGHAAMAFTDVQRADARAALSELAAFPDVTLVEAARHYAEHLRAVRSSVSTTELVRQFLHAKEADGRSHRYLADLKSRLGDFESSFGAVTVAAISTRELDDWLRGLRVAAQTRANHRRVLHAFFEFGIARGYASSNPVARTEKPKIVRGEPGVLQPSQLRALLRVADPALAASIAIAAFAGLRPAEVRRLEWADVDLEQRLIRVSAKASKTASRRLVPISENLLAWLLASPRRVGRVLPANDRKLFRKARIEAGIGHWPHDALRHSWVTYRFAISGDAAAIASEAGHDQTVLHKHYRALATKSTAEQWFSISPHEMEGATVPFAVEAVNA